MWAKTQEQIVHILWHCGMKDTLLGDVGLGRGVGCREEGVAQSLAILGFPSLSRGCFGGSFSSPELEVLQKRQSISMVPGGTRPIRAQALRGA